MRKKLTASFIAKLEVPEGKSSIKVFDAEVSGLGVRKMASGVATFIFEMRPKGSGRMKQIKIGRCTDLSVEQARSKARKYVIDFASPDYLKTEAFRGAMPSFAQAVADYDQLGLSKMSSAYRYKTLGTIHRYLLPKLGDIKVSDINRSIVADIVSPLMKEEKNATAGMVWEAASNVLTWAVKFGYRDDNPLIRLKPDFKKVARDRYLTLDELRKVWGATDNLSEIHRAAVRLLILLPFRKTEFLHTRWQELEGGWLSIPSSRTKNNDPIKLFLSDFAQNQLPQRRNDSDLMFTTNGTTPTRLGSKVLNKLKSLADIPQWQFHDFRRTFSTHMHEANLTDIYDKHFEIEACLNHRDGSRRGVAGVYNRASYTDQKKVLLQRWSDIVEGVVHEG